MQYSILLPIASAFYYAEWFELRVTLSRAFVRLAKQDGEPDEGI